MRELFFIGAWLAMTGWVWALFSYADKTVVKTEPLQMTDLVPGSSIGAAIEAFPALFMRLFDAVFGIRLLSLRCVLLSCAASTWCCLLLFILLQPLFKGTPLDLFGIDKAATIKNIVEQYGFIFVLVILCNLIPGYLSLAATRSLMGHANRVGVPWRLPLYLAMDFAITLAIMFSATVIYMSVGMHLTGFMQMPLGLFLKMLLMISKDLLLLDFRSQFHYFYAIPFYTIFWSNLWLWVCLLTGLIAVMLNKIVPDGSWAKERLTAAQPKPFAALGRLACLLLLCILAGSAVFQLI